VTEATGATVRAVYSGETAYESLLMVVFEEPEDAAVMLGGGGRPPGQASVIVYENVVVFYRRDRGVRSRVGVIRSALKTLGPSRG